MIVCGRRTLLIAFLCAAIPIAWAQEQQGKATLEGSVVNRITGQVLKNVHLVLQPEGRSAAGERSASTSATGAFQILNVDPG